MPEEVAAPTPEPVEPATPEPAEPQEPTLNDVLAGLTPDDAPAPEEAPEAEAEEKPADKPPEKPGDLFSDEALSTKEGIARARDEVRARLAKHDEAYLRVQEREAKFRRSLEAFKSEKAEVQTFVSNVRASLQALRRGTSAQRIEALGTLTGADGLKVFEELTLDLARGGKKAEPSPEVLELRKELADLRGHIERSKGEEEIRTRENFITRRKAEIAQAAGDSKSFPHLARLAPTRGRQIVQEVVEIITEAHAAGKPISDADALGQLERELALASQPLGAGPDLAIGATPNGAQKPVQARSTPGRSLSPSLTTKVGSVREITDEERLEELGKDTDYLRSLGLPV